MEGRRKGARAATPGGMTPVRLRPTAAATPTLSEGTLAHIEASIDAGRQIVLGTIAPVHGAAAAQDGRIPAGAATGATEQRPRGAAARVATWRMWRQFPGRTRAGTEAAQRVSRGRCLGRTGCHSRPGVPLACFRLLPVVQSTPLQSRSV